MSVEGKYIKLAEGLEPQNTSRETTCTQSSLLEDWTCRNDLAKNKKFVLGSQEVGGGAVVLTWLLTGAIFSYVKVSVAGMCRDSGRLFSCGVVTQVGSALGALVMFILVNQVKYFHQHQRFISISLISGGTV